MSLKMLHDSTTPLKCKYHSAHECHRPWIGENEESRTQKNALSRCMRKADQEPNVYFIEGRSPSRHKQIS